MIIAAVAIMPWYDTNQFIGLECPRGYILPGGKFDHKHDPSWHHTAAREAFEETGTSIVIEKIKYVFSASDSSGDYLCYGFWCPDHDHKMQDSREGKAVLVTEKQLLRSIYGPWYRCLFDVLRDKGLVK